MAKLEYSAQAIPIPVSDSIHPAVMLISRFPQRIRGSFRDQLMMSAGLEFPFVFEEHPTHETRALAANRAAGGHSRRSDLNKVD